MHEVVLSKCQDVNAWEFGYHVLFFGTKRNMCGRAKCENGGDETKSIEILYLNNPLKS